MTVTIDSRVKWTLKDGSSGTGTVIDNPRNGRVLVAVDPKLDAPSAFSREVHPVIYCTETWLSVLPAETEAIPDPKPTV